MKNFIEALLITILFTAVTATPVTAQATQYTYCEGPNGKVVVVTNHTCPPGFWRT
jgi:hypothetical protein